MHPVWGHSRSIKIPLNIYNVCIWNCTTRTFRSGKFWNIFHSVLLSTTFKTIYVNDRGRDLRFVLHCVEQESLKRKENEFDENGFTLILFVFFSVCIVCFIFHHNSIIALLLQASWSRIMIYGKTFIVQFIVLICCENYILYCRIDESF